MGVLFGGPPMRRPARVADAIRPIERLQTNRLFQIAQLAFGAANHQGALLINHGDARRVVAAIFQLAKPVENHSDDLLITNVTDNTTHFWLPSSLKKCSTPGEFQILSLL